MEKQKWREDPHYSKRDSISNEEVEERKSFLAKLLGKEKLDNLDDQSNALEIEMMTKLGKSENEIHTRLTEMGYEQKSGRQEKIPPIQPLSDGTEVAPDITTPPRDSFEVPIKSKESEENFTSGRKVKFNDFDIQNPEIPTKEDEFVSLVDEENSVVNISNLTLAECREIIGALESTIVEVAKTKTNQSLKFRGKTRSINFSIVYISEDNQEIISVTGRDVEDENDKGSYCHDFEIDGMTIGDWNKLRSLIQK